MNQRRRGITPWEPLEGTGLDNLRNEMDNIFDRFFGLSPAPRWAASRWAPEAWMPAVDVIEDNDSVIVRAALPNINKDNLEVKVSENVVTLNGRIEEEKEDKGRNYYLRELRTGSFRRDIPLPSEVESEKVSASYRQGVLTITLPKIKEAKSKEVKVKVE